MDTLANRTRTVISLAKEDHPAVSDQLVIAAFELLLFRTPSPDEIERFRSADLVSLLRDISRTVISVAKWRGPTPRIDPYGHSKHVLLFGAYGNGNLGDAIQPASLRRAIHRIRRDLEVWATSHLPARFPYDYVRTLPNDVIHDPVALQAFQLMIIGGGGLLAHPHEPLESSDWQTSLNIRTALFSIGAASSTAVLSSALIDHSSHVSARDYTSMEVLSTMKDEVSYCPDPILVDECLYAGKKNLTRSGFTKNILWILKDVELDMYSEILRKVDLDLDTVCVVEPFMDFPILARFPSAVLIDEAETLTRLIDRSDLVVTMRYHGAIISLQRGIPCFGLREEKISELFRRLGIQNNFSLKGEDFARQIDYKAAENEALLNERKIFDEQLHQLVSIL